MKWETLEEWLFENRLQGGTFTSHDVAAGLGVTKAEASRVIQAYLDAQRSEKSATLYVLRRTGRTSAAVWVAGTRTVDARATSGQFFDDVKHRFRRALEPDLVRIGQINPRARRRCEGIIDAVADGALKVLLVAVDGMDEDGAPV